MSQRQIMVIYKNTSAFHCSQSMNPEKAPWQNCKYYIFCWCDLGNSFHAKDIRHLTPCLSATLSTKWAQGSEASFM